MEFKELSDGEWIFIESLLPPRAGTGRPRVDDRMVLNGILYVLVTGCRWMDMPPRYGSYVTAWRRLRGWGEEGVWKRILEALILKGYSTGRLSLDGVAVDSTTIEARRGEIIGYEGYRHMKGSKVHVAVSKESLPLSIVVGPGDEHDIKRFIEVLDGIWVRAWC